MRRAIGIIFYVIAGFFIYMVCLLSFINQPNVEKWGIVAGFTLLALLFMSLGLAVNRFQNWKKHLGIVLLSGTGVTCFIIITFACLLVSDEFKDMMEPGTIESFNAYISGGIFTFITGALGILLLKTEKKEVEQDTTADH
jgi:ABC-type transport system involved in multi-copper enzyme maturation permease subunit